VKHRIRFTRRAWEQIDRASTWWQKHREKAPSAFDQDLDEAIDLLRGTPHVGRIVRARRGTVRALWLERIGYFLYYRILDDATVEILRFWHASRGSRPRL
jgi:plasmid stabilization system protein ParE